MALCENRDNHQPKDPRNVQKRPIYISRVISKSRI